MPKKTATARGGAQRNRPKVQKNIALVRPVSDEQELEVSTSRIADDSGAASIMAVATPTETKQSGSKRNGSLQSETKAEPAAPTSAPKGSAAARLANRRQSIVKAQQRAAASLVTVEHYAYVRRDLIFIAILAAIMFTAIIILRFVPGIGY